MENVRAPLNQTITCGFDETQYLVKICCPPSLVKQPQNFAQLSRFPDRNGKPRDVDDKTKFCEQWSKNDACKLDREFNISSINYFFSFYSDKKASASKDMFSFMQKSCMKTCGWAPQGILTMTCLVRNIEIFALKVAMMNMKGAQNGQEMDAVMIWDTL